MIKKKVDSPLIVALITFLVLALVIGIIKAPLTLIPSNSFYAYFNSGGLCVQIETVDRNVSFLISSGTLNSSTSYIQHYWHDGYFQFNSSENCDLDISFENLKVWITTNGVAGLWIDSGLTWNFPANTLNLIRWEYDIFDPFDYYTMSGIGLCGIILTCLGAFWTARKFRDGFDGVNTVFSIGIGFVIALIGLCLMVVWLF